MRSSITPLKLHEFQPPERARERWKNHPGRMRKLEALIRAGYRCAACGSEARLTIHHLTYKEGERDLRIVLCIPCHDEVHGRGDRNW